MGGTALTIKSVFQAVDKITGPVSTMTGSVDKFSASAKRSVGGISSGVRMLRGFLISAAAAVTTGAVAKAISDFAEKGDEIGRTSRMLGLGAEALQEIRYAANLADISAEDLATSFRMMNNNIGSLKLGQGGLYSTLKLTNPQLAAQLSRTTDSEKAFNLLIDAISREKDASKKASLAQAAFGRSGQTMIEMAQGGAKALAQTRAAAHEYGEILSDEAVRKAEAFDETQKKLTGSLNYLKNVGLEELVTAIQPYLGQLTEWIKNNRELIGQRVHDAVDKIVTGAEKLCGFGGKVVDTWNKANDLFGGKLPQAILITVGAYKTLTLGIAAAELAQRAFNVASLGGAAKGAAGAAAGVAGAAAGAAGAAGTAAGGVIGGPALRALQRTVGGAAPLAATISASGAASLAAGATMAAGFVALPAMAGYALIKKPELAGQALRGMGEKATSLVEGGHSLTKTLFTEGPVEYWKDLIQAVKELPAKIVSAGGVKVDVTASAGASATVTGTGKAPTTTLNTGRLTLAQAGRM